MLTVYAPISRLSGDFHLNESGFPEDPPQTVQDRIDLLGIDSEGTSVIVELKRGSNKLQLLQAISYAGMVARWGWEEFRALLKTIDVL